MFNASEVNQELVRAFNINLRFNGIAVTNFTVQNLYGKDHIIISFDKNMGSKQCMDYLNDLKEKIIKKSYKNKEAAGVSYNLQFFPFAFNTKHLPRDDKGRKRFSVEIDEGVFFNLKCYLAQALAGDVIEKMGSKFGVERIKKSIYDTNFDRNSYLYCMLFHDKGLQKDFVDSFSAEIEDYPSPPSDYLEEKGNLVYIKKGIFDDIEFIKDIIAYNTSLECRYLQTPSAENKTVDKLKYTMIDFIDRAADIPVRTITRTSYVDSKEDSVLIPLVQNGKFLGFLSKGDAYDLNRTFGDTVVTRIESRRLKNPYWSSDYVYAIDFADVDIACCVLNKIIESSVINAKHELAIDPELRLQALLPPPTPVRVPNGPNSDLTGISTQGFPTRSQGGALKDSPRRELEKFSVVLPKNPLDIPGTSKGFWPSTQLSSTAVSHPGPSSSLSSVGAATNVQALTSAWDQQPNSRLSQSTSGSKWQPLPEPGPSGLSWNKSGSASTSAWPSSAPSAGFSSWNKSGSASTSAPSGCSFSGPYVTQKPTFLCDKDSDDSRLPGLLTDARPIFRYSNERSASVYSEDSGLDTNLCTQQPNPWSPQSTSGNQLTLPGGSSWPQSGLASTSAWSSPAPSAGFSSWEGARAGANISEEEKKLIKALLYTLNLTNYTYDGVHTNFFAKDGKIVSLLHDNVDREKYFQAVRNYIIKEYCKDEEEARKLYDLDEFPFKFFPDPDYKKNQNDYEPKKTVVANISSGALSNLKILFSQKFRKNVDAIDISAVKKVEKREKDEWVDHQLLNKCSFEEAYESCFPDEGPMKRISITLEEDEYMLDCSRDRCEVKFLFKEQLRRLKDTSVAGKGESDDKPLTEEEKKLIKALLYTLNLTNYTYDGVHTNFFAKDGKIVSLLHDNVDREKYFQAVRNYIIKEYCKDEEEARKLYDLDEFPFKFFPDPDYKKNQNDYEPKKTVVANISSGALSNLKILFSQKFRKNVDAIDISAVKKVEKREKDEWVDHQLLNKCSFEEAYESCFPDEGPMKRISITLEGDEYMLDCSRDRCEVKFLFKEQLRRLKDTSVAGKGESDDKPLTEEEKELFKALLYAFNYSNHNFDLPDTNFFAKDGKIVSLLHDNVDREKYFQAVRNYIIKEYCKDEEEVYDLDKFPFKLNYEEKQEKTVVANISRGALFNLKKLFIYVYEKGDINTEIVEEAVKSKKDNLVDSKLKGIERKGGYYSRIKLDEAVTGSYPDKSALEHILIKECGAGYYLERDCESRETQEYDQGRSEAKRKKEKMKPDNKDSGISSGEATDAENVSSKAEATTSSGYESMDCENTREGSPKRKSSSSEDEGSPSKSPKRDSLPLSRLKLLSLSNPFYQIDKC